VVTRIFSQDVILDFPAIYYRRSPRHSLRNTNFLISRAIPVPLIAGEGSTAFFMWTAPGIGPVSA
jgi:hypothetical protein